MKIRVYVAGPMSKGWFGDHLRAALKSGDELRGLGFYPFLPQLSFYWDTVHPRQYEDWMEYNFVWLKACHALLRLPGESSGADREVALANETAIPVFHSVPDLVAHFEGVR